MHVQHRPCKGDFSQWVQPCPGAAVGAGGTAGWMGRAEVGGRRGHSCSPRVAVPGRDRVCQGAGCSGSKPCLGGSGRRVPLRHPKPQEPQPRCRGLWQLCLPKLAATQWQSQEQQLGSWLCNGFFSPHRYGHVLTCSSPKRPPRRAQGSASPPSKIGAVMLWHPEGSRRQTHAR